MCLYRDCPKAESKKYVSVCVFGVWLLVMRGLGEFLWRPTTLFPNNAWSWNRLFFHLPALCLASTPIPSPSNHLLVLDAWLPWPGYLFFLSLYGCNLLICMASSPWCGGHHRVTQIVVPGQWHSFISQMAIISLLWNYLIDCLNL